MSLLRSSRRPRALAKEVRGRIDELFQNREPTAGLVEVSLYWDFERDRSSHIVAESDLVKLVAATLELHYEPGINPHGPDDGGKATPLLCLAVKTLKPAGPFWWSTPGLERNDDDKGAVIFDWESALKIVWTRPGVELPESFLDYVEGRAVHVD